MLNPDITLVREYFLGLQSSVCNQLEREDSTPFISQDINADTGGYSRPSVLENGQYLEKAAVHFSHSIGAELPKAASERNPELAGKSFEALAISMIVHPQNPYVPTFHANLRFFLVDRAHWHFGGGFDLTPYYGFKEDAVSWHKMAKQACDPFGQEIYPIFKQACDDYFYLKHRNEPRGIGGLFFDDYNQGGFENAFALTRSVGESYLKAYTPIVELRKSTPYGEREREFQLYRRGRYVEFNLVYDRGTLFGLQSGGRTESILMSLPSLVSWKYDYKPDLDTPEHDLNQTFLNPQDWISSGP